MAHDLIEFWREISVTRPPFAHPRDLAVLEKYPRKIDIEPKDFDSFVASAQFGDFKDHRLHLSLVPQPYAGNLEQADIFVLLLNPGVEYTDYYGEYRQKEFRQCLVDNLRQQNSDEEFPFLWLNPEFCWHCGFMWWEEKLRKCFASSQTENSMGITVAPWGNYRDAWLALNS